MGIDTSILAAGASVLDTGINAISTIGQNAANRKFTQKMYNEQRADALADWNRNNAYNSPTEQMARLRAGGLNPNLVYGTGIQAAGNSSSQPRGSDFHTSNFQAPKSDLTDAITSYQDVKNKEATLDNLKSQNTVNLEQAALLKANQLKTTAETVGLTTTNDAYTADVKRQLADFAVQQAGDNALKTEADTQYTLDQNDRAAASNAMSLQEAATRILEMRAKMTLIPAEKQEIESRIADINQDARIKKFDADLKAQGVQPHDAPWWRAVGTMIGQLGQYGMGNVLDNVSNAGKSGFKEMGKEFSNSKSYSLPFLQW